MPTGQATPPAQKGSVPWKLYFSCAVWTDFRLLNVKKIEEWAMRNKLHQRTTQKLTNTKENKKYSMGLERSKMVPQACFCLGGIPNPSRGMMSSWLVGYHSVTSG
jgi:hypothetical protein